MKYVQLVTARIRLAYLSFKMHRLSKAIDRVERKYRKAKAKQKRETL
jgi:hypothetical protein